MKDDNNQHIGDLLKAYLKMNKLDEKLTGVDLKNAWEKIMGPSIARHTTKLELRKKVLIIKLDSSVLRQELVYGKDKIKDAVNDFYSQEIVDEVLIA
tara:strand:- start:339 stop:629 length:291 start_codon:yes stop_codon:yes gene_type:complete